MPQKEAGKGILSSWNKNLGKGTHFCIEFTAVYCHCVVGLFREYQSQTTNNFFVIGRQLPKHSGYLVTSELCWLSAADEEWYSPKRPSGTVAVNSSEVNTKVSAFFSLHCVTSEGFTVCGTTMKLSSLTRT